MAPSKGPQPRRVRHTILPEPNYRAKRTLFDVEHWDHRTQAKTSDSVFFEITFPLIKKFGGPWPPLPCVSPLLLDTCWCWWEGVIYTGFMGLFIGDNENLTAFSGNQPLPLFLPPPATSNIRWPWWQFGVRIKVISCMFPIFIFTLFLPAAGCV